MEREVGTSKLYALQATQVAQLAKLKTPTFGHWLSTGLIKPAHARGRGRSRRYLWSLTNLVSVLAAAELRRRGVPKWDLYKVVEVLEENRDLIEAEDGMLTLVTDGQEAQVVVGERALAEFMRSFDGGPIMAVALDKLKEKALNWVQ